MNRSPQEMELDALRTRYRRIQPPPFLAERIKANVLGAGHSPRRPIWAAVAVPVGLVLAISLFGPWNKDAVPRGASPPLPSIAAAARAVPAKPKTTVPSFVKLKGLSTPRPPARPEVRAPEQRSEQQVPFNVFKEINNAKA